MTDALLSTREAAARLGISADRVRQLIRAGRLPAQRLGRDWYIQPADLALVAVRTPGRPWPKR
jgi:excisionase family DNA binding protein